MTDIKEDKYDLELIDYGGFGCIYRPLLDCKLENTGDKYYISKILKKNNIFVSILRDNFLNNINNENEIIYYKNNALPYTEYAIGKKITEKIVDFERYFYPALEFCNIKFREMKKNKPETITKCKIIDEIIENNDINKSFINYKIKYIDNPITLLALYSSNKISNKKIQNSLIYNTQNILDSLQVLRENKIVHNDLKFNNIILNLETLKPFIIDFGISIDMDLPYFKNPIQFIKKVTNQIYGSDYNFNDVKTLITYYNLLSTHFYLNVPHQTYHVWDIYRHFICYIVNDGISISNKYGGKTVDKDNKNVIIEEFSLNEGENYSINYSKNSKNSKNNNETNINIINNTIINNFPNPYLDTFDNMVEPVIRNIIDNNFFLTSIYSDNEEYIKKTIDAMKHSMSSISKNKIEILNPSHIIKMISALINDTWKTWDIFTFCLYNYNFVDLHMNNNKYKMDLLSQMKQGIHPDYRIRLSKK
jgi:serine/threonine protein kinase